VRKIIPTCAVALSALALTLPSASDARTHHYRHHYRHYASSGRGCDAARHRHRVNGAIIGTVGGGIVGAAAHGGVGGTLLGAGVGALAGNEIGKNSTRC
jgi:hypothetical protein